MQTVCIQGLGFVGSALSEGLKSSANIIKIDPKLKTDISDLIKHKPEIVFICVPTPMNNNGDQDISIVMDVIDNIRKYNKDLLLVLKSTVLPNYLSELMDRYDNLVLNPEFLREEFAAEDFINSKTIIFGGHKNNCLKVSNFYKEHAKCSHKEHIFTDEISASLIKYTINSFLALKVVFFNELQNIFQKSGTVTEWNDFIDAVSSDKRIGHSHMQVPGPDGRYGFGGPCFPKDTNALLQYSRDLKEEFTLLKKAININNNIRAQYNDLTLREKEQNINFKKKIEE